jgi:hypothetical protein
MDPKSLTPSFSELNFAGDLQAGSKIKKLRNIRFHPKVCLRGLLQASNIYLFEEHTTHPRNSASESNDSTNPKTEFKFAICHTSDIVHALGMDIIRFLQVWVQGLIDQHQNKNQEKNPVVRQLSKFSRAVWLVSRAAMQPYLGPSIYNFKYQYQLKTTTYPMASLGNSATSKSTSGLFSHLAASLSCYSQHYSILIT